MSTRNSNPNPNQIKSTQYVRTEKFLVRLVQSTTTTEKYLFIEKTEWILSDQAKNMTSAYLCRIINHIIIITLAEIS